MVDDGSDGRKLLSSTVVTVANYCRRGCLTRLIATTRVSFVRRVRCVRQGVYGVLGGNTMTLTLTSLTWAGARH